MCIRDRYFLELLCILVGNKIKFFWGLEDSTLCVSQEDCMLNVLKEDLTLRVSKEDSTLHMSDSTLCVSQEDLSLCMLQEDSTLRVSQEDSAFCGSQKDLTLRVSQEDSTHRVSQEVETVKQKREKNHCWAHTHCGEFGTLRVVWSIFEEYPPFCFASQWGNKTNVARQPEHRDVYCGLRFFFFFFFNFVSWMHIYIYIYVFQWQKWKGHRKCVAVFVLFFVFFPGVFVFVLAWVTNK